MAPLRIALHLFGKIREAYHVTNSLVHTSNPKEPELLESVQQRTKTITALKRIAKKQRSLWRWPFIFPKETIFANFV